MNKSPRSVEDFILDNEMLLERTETLQKRNESLSFEVQNLKEIVAQMEDDYKALQAKLSQKERMLNGVKLNNSKLTLERNNLIDELSAIKAMSMFEFASRYCSEEEQGNAGRAFAQSMLGHTMTDEEVAMEETENHHDYYVGDDF